MDEERLEYLREWASTLECADERDIAHRNTVLELIEMIDKLRSGETQKGN